MKPPPLHLLRTWIHLADGGAATALEVTETFFPDLASGKLGDLQGGRLASFYEFSEDWDSWEIHPAGDELVCLFSGAMDFVLELPEGESTVALREPGGFVLVPQGTWHTVRVLEPSSALFVTPGEGTEHRPA